MDVAALSLSIDSAPVREAAKDLDTFSAAAKRAGSATGNPTGSIAKLVAMVQSMDTKLTALTGALDKAERYMGGMSKAAKTAAAANDNIATSAAKAASAIAQSDSHVAAYTQHLTQMANAQQAVSRSHVDANAHVLAYRNSLGQAEDGAKKVSTAIKFTAQDSLNASRQLADIGVTAASGMDPFLIAIQQGPQLLDILQNKAAVTGRSIGAVFRAAALEVGAFLLPFAPLIVAVGALAAGIAALTARANDDSGLKKYTTAMGYTQKQVEQLNAVTVTYGDTMKAVFQVGWSRIASAFGITTDQLSAKWSAFTDWMVTAIQAGLAGVYAALTGAQNIIPRLIDNIKTGKKEGLFEIIGGSYADQYRQAQRFMSDVVDQARKNAQGRQSNMAAGFRAGNANSSSAGAKAANDNKADC